MITTFDTRYKLADACSLANKVLNDKRFYDAIRNAVPFDDSNITNEYIAEIVFITFKSANGNVMASIFKPWNRGFSKVKGRFQPKKPNLLQINYYFFHKASAKEVAAVLVHEFIHLVDNRFPQYSFGHSGNSRNGNLGTAPYMAGAFAEKLMEHY